jgi:hypothetical protein
MSNPYSFALVSGIVGLPSGSLLRKAGRWCLSPVVVGSNAPAETTTRSSEIVAACGVLLCADFISQEGAVGLGNSVDLASSIGPD